MRRPAALVALIGAVVALLSKRSKAQRAERDLWTEAADRPGAPDLR